MSTCRYVVSHTSGASPRRRGRRSTRRAPGRRPVAARRRPAGRPSAASGTAPPAARAWAPGSCPAPAPRASRRARASPPSGRAAARGPGTQCRTALLTTTSTGPSGAQSRTSPAVNSTRPGTADVAAAASISGEESTPVTRADGQRSARVAVIVPSPQPRSTTVDGASACTRPSRSMNGRARSPAYRRYTAGSQPGGPDRSCCAHLDEPSRGPGRRRSGPRREETSRSRRIRPVP